MFTTTTVTSQNQASKGRTWVITVAAYSRFKRLLRRRPFIPLVRFAAH
jgi:hypothetical protein